MLGDVQQLHNTTQWQRECLGTFFMKPNYPGRSAHICTGEFLVNSALRNKGIGRTLAEKFLEWAPKLGYSQVMFNLVYESNTPARKILDGLGFRKVGRLRNAGILKGYQTAVDALLYGHSLVDADPERVTDLRFDKIRYYLETGQYPLNCDRQEKSRLRASAAHYRLENGKLLLKDREVISDPEDQFKLSLQIHQANEHFGVNRTTTIIAEKYHWARIKDTVAAAIKVCEFCRKSAPLPSSSASSTANSATQSAKRPRIAERPQATPPPKTTVDPGELDLGQFSPRYYGPMDLPFEEQSGEELAIARALIQANEGDIGRQFN